MILKKPSKSQTDLWSRLHMGKFRHQERLLLAEGYKVVQELLKSPWTVKELLIAEEKEKRFDHFLNALPESLPAYGLTQKDWKKLSQDKTPEGIMAVAAMACPKPHEIKELLAGQTGHLLMLHEINNPNNLGSILRTAHWFGIGTILLSRGSVDFTNPKVVRSSMGSFFHLHILADLDFAEVIPSIKHHHVLVGCDVVGGGNPCPCSRDTALLMGSESHGLPDALKASVDEFWHIPGGGNAESLSLPQAAAIAIYECTRKIFR